MKAGTLDYKLDALLSYWGETLGARRALARICLQSRSIAESLVNHTPVDQFNLVRTLGTPARYVINPTYLCGIVLFGTE